MASPYQTRPGSAGRQAVQLDPSFRLKNAEPPPIAVTAPSGEASMTCGPEGPLPNGRGSEGGSEGMACRQAGDCGSSRNTPAGEAAKTAEPLGAASRAATAAAGFGQSIPVCPPFVVRSTRRPDAAH